MTATSAQPNTSRSFTQGAPWAPWREQKATRAKLVETYMTNFQMDLLYQQARSASWHASLFQYVRAVAEVQAQLIVPGGGMGYQSAILFGHIGKTDERNRDQLYAEFWNDARQQAATGYIKVTVPREAIDSWVRSALSRGVQVDVISTTPTQTTGERLETQKNGVDADLMPAICEQPPQETVKQSEISADEVF